jgi:hypothetical protein
MGIRPSDLAAGRSSRGVDVRMSIRSGTAVLELWRSSEGKVQERGWCHRDKLFRHNYDDAGECSVTFMALANGWFRDYLLIICELRNACVSQTGLGPFCRRAPRPL